MNMHAALSRHSVQLSLGFTESKGLKLADEIVEQVSEQWGLTKETAKGHKRIKMFVDCRKEISRILYYNFHFSTTEIGIVLKKDHTTILHYLGLRGKRSGSGS